MEKIKKYITIENILCLFIIICPILDMASFLFRNNFGTSISPSTIIRPIIPIIIILILFFKEKIKLKLILGAGIYFIYGITHLLLFAFVKTDLSYSTVIHEAQYIINYSFMILNLFIYTYVFWKKDTKKLKTSVVVSIGIYIISIYIAILTKTSSSTYIEGMGYKGWFESGNSISSILILSLFIVLNLVKEKKYRYYIAVFTGLIGIFLTILIGTRVGLFGFILVLVVYAISEIFISLIRKTKINKKIILGSISLIIVIVVVIGIVGSNTLQRRKHLKDIEANLTEVTEEGERQSHISRKSIRN